MIKEFSNYSLKQHNTLRIDVIAKKFIVCETENEIIEVLHDNKNKDLLILGSGSNILFTKDFNHTILKPLINSIELLSENNQDVFLRVGAGVNWDDFVAYAVKNNYYGIENLSNIPGNVGASPIQNIGAYGVEAKDVINSIETIRIKTRKKEIFENEDCAFGYRSSIFKTILKNQYIITHVNFKLSKQANYKLNYGRIQEEIELLGGTTLANIRKAIIKIRGSKLPDPNSLASAGSFFKNPILPISQVEKLKVRFSELPVYQFDKNNSKIAAGWLIDQCGLKGFRKGDTGIHKDQALVIVNYGSASGTDIEELALYIQAKVLEKFEIMLEPEVNII